MSHIIVFLWEKETVTWPGVSAKCLGEVGWWVLNVLQVYFDATYTKRFVVAVICVAISDTCI